MSELIYWMKFSVKFANEVIVQPFTSKVSRIILNNYSNYAKISERNEPLKPIRVTVLRDEDNKPLFKKYNGVLTLKPDTFYYFELTSLDYNLFDEVISNPYINTKVYTTEARAELVESKAVEDVNIADASAYRIEFRTPTLIQPPRPKVKRRKERYILFPFPPYLFLSLQNHWNKYNDKKIKLNQKKLLYYFREVDYRLKPITVVYEDGIKKRGFIGWTLFALEAKKGSLLREDIRKLLAYANYIGVGKSRAIGFGEVIVREV